jgi:hypothetical protein
MKIGDALVFAGKVEDEVEELEDLKPGVQKIIPGLLKTRIKGRRWKLGVVLEKDED